MREKDIKLLTLFFSKKILIYVTVLSTWLVI